MLLYCIYFTAFIDLALVSTSCSISVSFFVVIIIRRPFVEIVLFFNGCSAVHVVSMVRYGSGDGWSENSLQKRPFSSVGDAQSSDAMSKYAEWIR